MKTYRYLYKIVVQYARNSYITNVSGNLILLCHREESVSEVDQIEILPWCTAFENETKAVLKGYI